MRVEEGGSVNISCSSTGLPTPTISWKLNNQSVALTPTETLIDPKPRLSQHIVLDVMLGSILSTIEIIDAQYPDDDGVYTCTGTNNAMNVSTFSIQLQVLGM